MRVDEPALTLMHNRFAQPQKAVEGRVDQRYIIDEGVQHGYVGGRDARTLLPFLLPGARSARVTRR